MSCFAIHTFKKQLKTHLFASAFPSSSIVLNAPLIQWSTLIYYLVVLDFARAWMYVIIIIYNNEIIMILMPVSSSDQDIIIW